MIQLASALRMLHEMKIAHKDIKLQNILLFQNSFGQIQVKLSDFGTSWHL